MGIQDMIEYRTTHKWTGPPIILKTPSSRPLETGKLQSSGPPRRAKKLPKHVCTVC